LGSSTSLIKPFVAANASSAAQSALDISTAAPLADLPEFDASKPKSMLFTTPL